MSLSTAELLEMGVDDFIAVVDGHPMSNDWNLIDGFEHPQSTARWNVVQAIRLVRGEVSASPDAVVDADAIATLCEGDCSPLVARLYCAVLLRLGACRYSEAWLPLHRELQSRPSGGLYLSLAYYFRHKPMPELGLARRYYLKAAVRGRIQGLIGAFEMSRELEEGWISLFSLTAMIVLAPIYRLMLPVRSKNAF